MGVPTLKSPSDMWNYQEILFSLQPSLVVEFGTCKGGSALFFASVLRQIGKPFLVLSVDINLEPISEKTKRDSNIKLLTMSSTDARVAKEIATLRQTYQGPAFFILDSDHSKAHVLEEMESLRGVTMAGDYVIVEDSNVNGHPVLRSHGPGPYEAMVEYFRRHPDDYSHDHARETKFGFTFATNGYLIRTAFETSTSDPRTKSS